MDLDEAGWQEQQRRVERWFVRRGLPHLVHRHTAAEHVWTRAFPALVILFALQLAGAVRRDGTGLGARTDALLDVIVVFTGGVALGGSWVGLNRRRGRPLFARPERVGRLEVAVFVLVPIMPALLRRRPADALTIVIVDLVLAGLVYLVTSYGLLPLTRRVLARLPRQTAIVAGLLARTVPLLLVVVGLLFLRADVWQSAGTQSGGAYLMLLALLAGLAVAFLATTLTREPPGLHGFGSWDEVGALVARTPAEHLLARPASRSPDPKQVAPAPTRGERANAAVVLFVTQTVHVALVSLLFGVFLLLLGVLAVPVATVGAWTGSTPHVVGHLMVGSSSFAVAEPMLRVVGFLTALASLYISAVSLTDATYRRQFSEDAAGQLRRAFAVRAVYLARVVPGVRGDVPRPAPGPVVTRDADAPMLTRRALRAAGHLRPVPPYQAQRDAS